MTRTPRSSSASDLDLGVRLLPHLIVARVNNQEPSDGGLIRPKKGLLSRLFLGGSPNCPLGPVASLPPTPKLFCLFLGHPSPLHGPSSPSLSPGLPSAFL